MGRFLLVIFLLKQNLRALSIWQNWSAGPLLLTSQFENEIGFFQEFLLKDHLLIFKFAIFQQNGVLNNELLEISVFYKKRWIKQQPDEIFSQSNLKLVYKKGRATLNLSKLVCVVNSIQGTLTVNLLELASKLRNMQTSSNFPFLFKTVSATTNRLKLFSFFKNAKKTTTWQKILTVGPKDCAKKSRATVNLSKLPW